MATIEKLRQDAESKEAETDLQNEINRIALLKLEQANYQQLLTSTQSHIKGTYSLTAIEEAQQKSSGQSGKSGG